MTELLTWITILPVAIAILFNPLQLGIDSNDRQTITQAVYFGARAATISGGEDANVDAAFATELSTGGLDSNSGDGTVSWGVYSDSGCSSSVSAGTVPYGTGLYVCITYKQPYNILFFPAGTYNWHRVQFIRADAGS